MSDLAFKFPIKKAISRVEIPFSFQQNFNPNKKNFHTYISIKNTPKLYIDITDKNKIDKYILNNNIKK